MATTARMVVRDADGSRPADVAGRDPAVGRDQAPQDRLMRVSEVAAELGCHRSWLYRQIRVGRLPSVQLGRGQGRGKMLRLDPLDVLALMREREGGD